MKILKKLSIAMILIVFSINCYGKNKNVEIMIPISNGSPKIENVYIDLKFNDSGGKKLHFLEKEKLKSKFFRKIKSEFNKTKPKLNLLARSLGSLKTLSLLPKKEQQQQIKELSKLGVLKVHIVFDSNNGSFYASVNSVDFKIPIYSMGTHERYWMGQSKSIEEILYSEVYEQIIKTLTETNNFYHNGMYDEMVKRNEKSNK